VNPVPGAGLIAEGVFVLCAAMAVAGALIAVLSRRIIRGVCGLALCCLGLAGLYYFLHSPFLALMEVLIYVGAVCVTIAFAIMLSEPDEQAALRRASRRWAVLALAVGAAVFAGLLALGLDHPWPIPAQRQSDGSVAAIGLALLTTYSVPFELISLVLLVAILGALGIARTGRRRP
jgi:NADH-quinone oxidoreductase subunit J